MLHVRQRVHAKTFDREFDTLFCFSGKGVTGCRFEVVQVITGTLEDWDILDWKSRKLVGNGEFWQCMATESCIGCFVCRSVIVTWSILALHVYSNWVCSPGYLQPPFDNKGSGWTLLFTILSWCLLDISLQGSMQRSIVDRSIQCRNMLNGWFDWHIDPV